MLEAFLTTVHVKVSQITKTLTDALNEMTRTFMSRMEALEQSFTTRAPCTDVVAIKNDCRTSKKKEWRRLDVQKMSLFPECHRSSRSIMTSLYRISSSRISP